MNSELNVFIYPSEHDWQTNHGGWLKTPFFQLSHFPWYRSGLRQPTSMQLLALTGDDPALLWRVTASDLHSSAAEGRPPNGAVHLDSCAELFLQPAPLSPNYFNLEVSCCGVPHLGYGPSREHRALAPLPLLARVAVASSLPGPSKAECPSSDALWLLEVRLPLSVLQDLAAAPVSLDCPWRANFYRCGGATDPQYAAWAPVSSAEPNFHLPECFGALRFVPASASTPATKQTATSSSSRSSPLHPSHAIAQQLYEASCPPIGCRTFLGQLARPQIICFGDSITQNGSAPEGFVTALSHYFTRRADVLNRGYSGYTTRSLLKALRQLDPGHAGFLSSSPFPTLLTLCLGANDRVLPQFPQHVPLLEFRENLETLIGMLRPRDATSPSLLLITPPQVDPERWGRARQSKRQVAELTVFHDTEIALQYAQAVKEVALQLSIPCVDLWSLTTHAKHDPLVDGLHLSAYGNLQLFKALKKCISTHFPSFFPQTMSHDFPLYDDPYFFS